MWFGPSEVGIEEPLLDGSIGWYTGAASGQVVLDNEEEEEVV